MYLSKSSINKFFSFISFGWFFCLYPFFVQINAFSYVNISGLYIINIVLSLILILILVFNIVNYGSGYFCTTLSLCGLIISVLVLIVGGRDIYGILDNGLEKSISDYFIPFLIYSLGMLSLGRIITFEKIIKSKVIYLSLLTCLFILFHIKGFRLDYSLLRDQSLIGIYLIIGDTISIAASLILFKKGFNVQSYLWFVFFAICLYLNNSRASFFIFIISYIVFYVIHLLKMNKNKAIVFSILTCVLLLFLSPYLYDLLLLNSRMASLITGSSDYSENSRAILLNQGMNGILNNAFIGDLGGQINSSGRLGGYIHNVLAYYRQFGLISFVCIIISMLSSLYYFCKIIININRINSNYIFAPLFIFFISLISVVTARSIPYSFVFFGIGLIENIYRSSFKNDN